MLARWNWIPTTRISKPDYRCFVRSSRAVVWPVERRPYLPTPDLKKLELLRVLTRAGEPLE